MEMLLGKLRAALEPRPQWSLKLAMVGGLLRAGFVLTAYWDAAGREPPRVTSIGGDRMPRYFNTAGPCRPGRYYMLARLTRLTSLDA